MAEKQDNSFDSYSYWRSNLKLLATCLTIWFVVSYGFGILLVDVMNTIKIGGYPLGFWFAQQGSIITFIILVFCYAAKMNKLDRHHDVHEE